MESFSEEGTQKELDAALAYFDKLHEALKILNGEDPRGKDVERKGCCGGRCRVPRQAFG